MYSYMQSPNYLFSWKRSTTLSSKKVPQMLLLPLIFLHWPHIHEFISDVPACAHRCRVCGVVSLCVTPWNLISVHFLPHISKSPSALFDIHSALLHCLRWFIAMFLSHQLSGWTQHRYSCVSSLQAAWRLKRTKVDAVMRKANLKHHYI